MKIITLFVELLALNFFSTAGDNTEKEHRIYEVVLTANFETELSFYFSINNYSISEPQITGVESQAYFDESIAFITPNKQLFSSGLLIRSIPQLFVTTSARQVFSSQIFLYAISGCRLETASLISTELKTWSFDQICYKTINSLHFNE